LGLFLPYSRGMVFKGMRTILTYLKMATAKEEVIRDSARISFMLFHRSHFFHTSISPALDPVVFVLVYIMDQRHS
jgi:hypothetical protein